MKNKYPQQSLTALQLHRLTIAQWLPAIKLCLMPFLLAFVGNILLAISSHFISTVTELYLLRALSAFVIFYFVMLAFYLIHDYWRGEQTNLSEQIKQYSKRFAPALLAFVVIFAVMLLLMSTGIFVMRVVAPYAQYLGNLAPIVLVSMIGLLGAFWVLACFYWPFFVIRDGEKTAFAIKHSFTIAALTKSIMVYLPAIATILLLLFTDYQMKWMVFLPWMWANLLLGFVIKWLLGAWVLTLTCVVMNQSKFLIQQVEAGKRPNGT